MYKVLIRPLDVSDALTSYKWRNNSEIWKYTGSRPDIEITPEIESEWIKKVLKDSYSKRFAITANDKYIGNVQLTNINEGQAEYHIFIGDKDFWGKGIAFSATKQIIRYAKNVLHLEKIFLRVKNQNKKAVSLYENCGFEIVSELEGEVTMSLILEKTLVPKVSIFCMVYNHEPYLKECLEGFLMQQCTFDFEIVIGEDFSTDNSRGIILEYANKYPGKFKLLLHDKNIGAARNQIMVFENCIGEYIAMCEGDDYWTDPLKLQKQVDFLEENIDFSFCCHRYKIFDQNTLRFNPNIYPLKFSPIDKELKGVIIDFKEYHSNWITQPLTAVFRKESLLKHDIKQFNYFRDVHLFYLLLQHGRGICHDNIFGVYRHHEGGVHIGSSAVKRAFHAVKIYEELYFYSKDVHFFKIYFANILTLLKSNKMMKIEALKSLFCKLSFFDKIKLIKFLVYYKLKA